MAQRVPFHDTQRVIETLEADGGVILVDFTSKIDVDRVNEDARPFLADIKAEVSGSTSPLTSNNRNSVYYFMSMYL